MKDNYIKVYDNVLSEAECLYYISLIEKAERKAGRHIGRDGNPTVSNIKLSEDVELSIVYPNDTQYLLRITAKLIDRYEKDVGTHIPATNTEMFRGRVYRENAGYFKPHIDVASRITYGRMITIIFYLNDIEEGGEICFRNQDVTVKAKRGRVILFPPHWKYVHEAKPSLKGDRYIIRTFARGPE